MDTVRRRVLREVVYHAGGFVDRVVYHAVNWTVCQAVCRSTAKSVYNAVNDAVSDVVKGAASRSAGLAVGTAVEWVVYMDEDGPVRAASDRVEALDLLRSMGGSL